MRYEEVLAHTMPDVTGPAAVQWFLEFLFQTKWRCYSDTKNPHVETLINTFVTDHARVPGLITDSLRAIRPMKTFDGKTETGFIARGALYLNGAFFFARNQKGVENLLFFIDEETAKSGNYPIDGYVVPGAYLQMATPST